MSSIDTLAAVIHGGGSIMVWGYMTVSDTGNNGRQVNGIIYSSKYQQTVGNKCDIVTADADKKLASSTG